MFQKTVNYFKSAFEMFKISKVVGYFPILIQLLFKKVGAISKILKPNLYNWPIKTTGDTPYELLIKNWAKYYRPILSALS
jgi:hypothetical protein